MEASDRVYFKDRQSCRRWFERHHLERDHIWVVAFKKHTGEPCVGYDDLVEEAICFGWIDGIVKGVDEDRFLRRLSPRRAKSVWSVTNVKRARRMIAAGL
ncbi:MAG: YdeI family protein, partial [Terriglobia bacterium]